MLALLVQTALLLAAGIAFLVVLSFDRRMELPRAAAEALGVDVARDKDGSISSPDFDESLK